MIYLLLYIVIVTILYTFLRDRMIMDVYLSNLFGDKKNNYFFMYICFLLFPFMSVKLISFKKIIMSIKIKYVVLLIVILFITLLCISGIKYYNQSAMIRLNFNKTMNSRLVILNNIKIVITQKFQLSKINDSSFYKNLEAITSNRKDGVSVIFKLVVENNPNINFSEVSSMYKEVANTIDNERNKLIVIENSLASMDNEYTVLHTLIPSSLYLFYENKSLGYKAISSIENKNINISGIDSTIYLK
jgi:hypothetical protein